MFLLCCDFEVWGVDVSQKRCLMLLLLGGLALGCWYCVKKERIFSCLRISISLFLLLLLWVISCIGIYIIVYYFLFNVKCCRKILKGRFLLCITIIYFELDLKGYLINCILYLLYKDKIAIKHLTFLWYETDGLRRRAHME